MAYNKHIKVPIYRKSDHSCMSLFLNSFDIYPFNSNV